MINHQLFGIDKLRNLFQLMPRFPQCRSDGKTSVKSCSRIWRWNATRGSKLRSEASSSSSRPGAMLYGFFVFFFVKFKTSSCHECSILYLLNMHITIQFCIHLPALQINTLQQSDLAMENPPFMDDFSSCKL